MAIASNSYNVALNFEDGVTRFITCNPGETVLDAAYRHKINLPMDCSDGVCGTCKCHCTQGDFDLGEEYLDDALSEAEAAEGLVLTCQMVPAGDCVVNVPTASSVCRTGNQSVKARVEVDQALSDTAVELRLTAEQGVDFLPGQYVSISVPGTDQTRSYSFSSAPGSQALSFLIRNVPDGLMSQYLTQQAKAGDELTLTGPMGSFYLRPVQRPVLMLAGGTGLAPFLAMLETLAKDGSDHPVHLIYGVTRDTDLVALEALQRFADSIDNFSFITCVSDTDSQHPRLGYVTQHMDEAPLNDGEVDVYLCGPPPMVNAVTDYFRAEGIEPASFYYEKFTPSLVAPAQEKVA